MKLSAKGKKTLKISSIVASILVALVSVVVVVFGFLSPDEIPTYSFSGFVYADGVAVEGATVSCGVMKTETDSEGFYCFEGLTSVVEVTVSKEDFLFGKDLVYVSSDSENINFSGFEIYSMNGVVKNGMSVVPFAEIVVFSELGEYRTRADAFGNFSLPKLAGEVSLSATSEGVELFSQSFNKFKDDELVVSCQTSVSGKVNIDCEGEYDFVVTLDGELVELDQDLTFDLDGVSPNSILKIESSNYFIEKNEVVVNIENGVFEFDAFKYYTLKGYVKSGDTPLNNVRIVAGKNKSYSSTSGYFEIKNLYGEVEVSSYLRGYDFSNFICSSEETEHNLNGQFDLSGRVSVDTGLASGIRVVCGEKFAITNAIGQFKLEGVSLGEIVSIASDDYFVKTGSVEITGTKDIVFVLEKKYNLNISVESLDMPLDGVQVELGGQVYYTDANGLVRISGLYGSNDFEVTKDGYRFESNYKCDHMHTSFDLVAEKYYDLKGSVLSGDKPVVGATVYVDGLEYSTNANGEFEILQLYKSGIAKITHPNFDSEIIRYSLENNQFNIQLSYSITGQVMCGNNGVGLVEVTCTQKDARTKTVVTDFYGNFEVQELYGEVQLSFSKEYYTIDSLYVFGFDEVEINSTYYISGRVFNSEGNISNLKIYLIKNLASDTQEFVEITDSEGLFSFENLSGEYLLAYDTESGYELLPNEYQVIGGGIYDFADNGYSIKGCVTSGGEPVAGVLVKAGDHAATTNDRGYYKFDLLISAEELVLSKEGYSFGDSIIVDSSFDGRDDVDFECTYSVSGVVCSGTALLEGAMVTIGNISVETDEFGEYLISGIAGTQKMSVEKEGFVFSVVDSVSCAGQIVLDGEFVSQITIVSADLLVSGATTNINGMSFETNQEGVVSISGLKIGDTLTFEKPGYVIETYIFTSNVSSVQLESSYSVYGKVYIVSELLDGVKVTCGENSVITGMSGEFSFANISGSANITFEKDLYDFDVVYINEYCELDVKAKFSVSGYVSVTSNPLAGVTVTAGEKSAITDSDGYFEIFGLQYSTFVEFEKYGYSFVGENYVSSPCTLDISARYSINGRIVSGELAISNAKITLSTGEIYYSDDNGYYSISNVVDMIDISVSKNGYDDATIEAIDKFNNALDFNLTYALEINFTGVSNIQDIIVKINDVAKAYSSSSIKIEKLSGESYVVVQKDGYSFTPSQFIVNKNSINTISIMKEFIISGTIKTASGVAMANVPVVSGKNIAITDANGYYCLRGLTGTVRPSLVLDVVDNSYKGESLSLSIALGQFDADATINYSNISDFDYVYYMFKKGYSNLYNANSYQIFATGTVSDSSSGSVQDVNVVYKKDTKNRRIIQDLNWHDGKVLGIVDPRVSQLSYIDMNTKTVKWQKITGTSVGRDANSTAYTTNWTTTDYDTYLNSFGVNAEGFYPYVINKSTIDSSKALNLTYDKTTGLYKFELNLTTNEAMYKYYVIKMTNMCSSQQFQSFNSVKLSYVVNNQGFINQLDINEVYKVKASIVTPTITAKFVYKFKTLSLNEVIDDIDVSSLGAIRSSLSEKTPTLKIATAIASDYSVDLYFDKRRMLV